MITAKVHSALGAGALLRAAVLVTALVLLCAGLAADRKSVV